MTSAQYMQLRTLEFLNDLLKGSPLIGLNTLHVITLRLNLRKFLSWLIQLILNICRFCICKSAYLLKFVCNPQVSTQGASLVTDGHIQSREKFE